MADDRLESNEPIRDPEHLLPEHAATPAVPGRIAAEADPDLARAEIEQTRARMSTTIDQLEGALLRKKEQIQEKLDVMAPVRENPLPSVGLVFGAGLVLGFLTGGKDKNESDGPGNGLHGGSMAYGPSGPSLGVEMDVEGEEGWGRDWKTRSHEWERRARRLMKTLNQQEEELRALRAQMGMPSAHMYGSEHDGEEAVGALGSALRHVRDAVAGGVAGVVTSLFHGGHDREGDGQAEAYSYDAGATRAWGTEEESLQQEYVQNDYVQDEYVQGYDGEPLNP